MMIRRDHDVILGERDLEPLFSFEKFPVFMGCVKHPSADDICVDMSFHISRSSGMIQLNPLVPLEILYPESHGAGFIGASWEAHHQAFAEFIASYSPGSVLEVGGGHGILSVKYAGLKQIPWTILEPNPTPIPECKATVLKGFFDSDFTLGGGVDAVVHSHLFEHIYQPLDFLQDLKKFIKVGKRLIFSVPNMKVMVERKFTNCLNFEHTVYLSEQYIEFLLAGNGFKLERKEYFRDDHSIFYAAVRDDDLSDAELSGSLYQENKKLYLDYVDHHKALIKSINERVAAEQGRDVYLFGAHVQAQYLIGFGLDISRIKAVLDNDKNKTGKRLYGTDLNVATPASLVGINRPMVIIRAGTFTQEIMEQITALNPTTEFLQ
ncbi:class I SAM-dependent methyltransferase [Pseudomonas kuykendallii]|uniref:Methyltransferase n=1 Tax=Pseudomonas kuykendallii TaxID=1007099 RepID=A0A2W5ESV7_9PSED|nr:methyltransferase domain-containing protein [Pseudomonas kuykendallii]PZP21952.1 MAG: methyltransferase [Pseudomonas kuykendallii]